MTVAAAVTTAPISARAVQNNAATVPVKSVPSAVTVSAVSEVMAGVKTAAYAVYV